MDKQIPLHRTHEKLGGKIIPFAGFLMPVRYSSDLEEHHVVRKNAGVFDVSHMGEFLLEGADALDLIQRVTSNDASALSVGQAQYSCLPNKDGGIADDLIVYKMDERRYMLVVNASNIEKDWNWIKSFNHKNATMKNLSDDLCLFAIQGPKASSILQRLTPVELSSVKYYHFVAGEFADEPNIIISNTGYTGAGGFEIYLPNNAAEKIWNAIFEAGKSENILPVGLGARDTLRLEMGYCLYGNDIDDTTSPLEAGLGWITKFTKDFTNSPQLKKQKEEGVQKKLSAFKMIDRGIPRRGYVLKDRDGKEIGRVTSGTQSPTLGVGIGLGYVSASQSQAGTEIFIDIRGNALKAVICKLPFIQQPL